MTEKQTATTYVDAPWSDDMTKALAALKVTASQRLGGKDGVRLLSINGDAGGKLRTTWSREWDSEEN